MKTSFEFESAEELNSVKFSFNHICDRQYADLSERDLLESACWIGFSRIDMFWIECKFDGIDLGSLSIEPNMEKVGEFSISQNWNRVQGVHYKIFQELAREFFVNSQEFQQMKSWVSDINSRVLNLFGSWDQYKARSRQRRKDFHQEKIDAINSDINLFEMYVESDNKDKRKKLSAEITSKMGHLIRSNSILYSGVEHFIYLYKNEVIATEGN